jgi:hypothetical protein
MLEQIVHFEEWFLDDQFAGKAQMLLRLHEVPRASRRDLHDRLEAELA